MEVVVAAADAADAAAVAVELLLADVIVEELADWRQVRGEEEERDRRRRAAGGVVHNPVVRCGKRVKRRGWKRGGGAKAQQSRRQAHALCLPAQ